MAKKVDKETVEALTHEEATRRNIPTAEFHSVVREEDQTAIRVAYERRNRDLDPQLVWPSLCRLGMRMCIGSGR